MNPVEREQPRYNACVKVRVKLSLSLTKHHTVKTYWRVEL